MSVARVVDGDLLEQPVEVIVNAWNRNVIPWWLLWPVGVAGAIRSRAGVQPFIEVGRAGSMPTGSAVLTGAGRLPHRGIIHVAGIDLLWRATQESVRGSVGSAMDLVRQHGFRSVAFPLLGAGVGGKGEERSLRWMQDELAAIESDADVVLVRFKAGR